MLNYYYDVYGSLKKNETLKKKFIEYFTTDKSKYKFIDILTSDEQNKLDILTDTILNYLNKKNIKYFVAFGTLLGVIRHGMRMPWDDDIDILISIKDLDKLLDGLDNLTNNKNSKFGKYKLTNKIVLEYKKIGIPVKIYFKGYPFVDINLYEIINGNIVVPEEQLINGHIHTFNQKYDEIFPLKKGKLGDKVVSIPNKSIDILKNQYGNDVLKICKITYNHKNFCKQKKDNKISFINCENKNASEKIKFTIKIEDLDPKFVKPNFPL